jgi:DNA (cytosine-5)-methyltransferase 1
MGNIGIPVVDIFAGPGGLGEGFASIRSPAGERIFRICTSIEKDPVAHKTLTLRGIFRALEDGNVPEIYYDYIRGAVDASVFFSDPKIAPILKHVQREAHCLELGVDPDSRVDKLIREGIEGSADWILIGGPPCQAYSLVGRSRRQRVDPNFEHDPKHLLYREYLRIIRKFRPSVFVMENVKGMLSSKHSGESIFARIRSDLSNPARDLHYEIRSFVTSSRADGLDPDEFTIYSENFGIPQARHRVILFGVRADRAHQTHNLLTPRADKVTIEHMLDELPPLRSRLSKEPDTPEVWWHALQEGAARFVGLGADLGEGLGQRMARAAKRARRLSSPGGAFINTQVRPSPSLPADLGKWMHDPRLEGVCQHEARGHMRSDLHRYLFASCFAAANGTSPKIRAFPERLLPDHRNVEKAKLSIPFEDRFRVQVRHSPSTTVVSHIAKDGHYYIHYDPSQCRSLTVREAARLQTFPDNYFFEGNRTQQYHQVGNAVPPFLARQIAEIVASFLEQPLKHAGQEKDAVLTES